MAEPVEKVFGARYVKKPRRFLKKLRAALQDDALLRHIVSKLNSQDKEMLASSLVKEDRIALIGRVEAILNAKDFPADLEIDPDEIGIDGSVAVGSALCAEFRELMGGTLYLKQPAILIATVQKGDADLIAILKEFGKELHPLSLIADKSAKQRTREEEAVFDDGVRRITRVLNTPGKIEPVKLDAMLEAEIIGDLEAIRDGGNDNHDAEPGYAGGDEAPRAPIDPGLIAALARTRRYALCLSGGGIRSATFNLGLIQGLAANGLLDKFDFLSTVSGGGFIGGWLSAWIRRSGLANVQSQIREHPDPEEVRYLRAYSNYLAPKAGMFSADTWVIAATYLRNLAVTWMTFLPCLFLALLGPRLIYAVTFGSFFDQAGPTMIEATVLAVMGIWYIASQLPAMNQAQQPASSLDSIKKAQHSFLVFGLAPLLLSSWLFAKVIWLFGGDISLTEVIGFAVVLVGIGWIRGAIGLFKRVPFAEWISLYLLLLLAAAISGAIGYFPFKWLGGHIGKALYLSVAPPVILTLALISATIIAALTSRFTGLEDEEWWARSGAYFLISIVAWAGVNLLCLYVPQYLNLFDSALLSSPTQVLKDAGGDLKLIANIAGAAATILGVLMAKSEKTPGKAQAGGGNSSLLMNVSSAAAVIYIVVVLNLILDRFFHFTDSNASDHFAIIDQTTATLLLGVGAVIGVFLAFASFLINGNKFTPHYFYRNRIIRAYLGASAKRKPDAFTGLDDKDNVQMWHLRGQRPFHVVNMALNLVNSERLAWQERKAESFTVTPICAGSLWLGYRDSKFYGQSPLAPALKTGISLGTAVSVSGAAVSPNMGYMLSSSASRFLLAMFAVRLGIWLGNPGPAGNATWNTSGPGPSVWPIVVEALGTTGEQGQYVYLSDGGHFENLGLYEMVMRGCTQIVVSDASTDDAYDFESLAVSIRKIRIDFGIPIDFEKFGPVGRFEDELGEYCAVGRVRYSVLDPNAPDGTLLYFKASLRGGEPRDVVQYQKANPTFPQQTIADQFFTESQFESYRALASHMMEQLSANNSAKPLPLFMAGVEQKVASTKATMKRLARSALARYARA